MKKQPTAVQLQLAHNRAIYMAVIIDLANKIWARRIKIKNVQTRNI